MDKFDVIIQGGQSNAEGFGLGPVEKDYEPNDKIYYLNAKKSCVWTTPAAVAGEGVLEITYFDEPLELFIAEERDAVIGKAGDFALSFAEEYIKAGYLEEGRKLLIIRAAVGGTGFVQTKEWGVGNILHEKLVELSKYALDLNPENRLVAFLWHQGEHEAARGNDPTVYENQLVEMVEDIRTRLNSTMLPFIAGDFVYDWRNKNAEKTLPIVESIKNATKKMGAGAFVESDGLKSNDQEFGNGDEIHFSRASLQKLGVRYFKEYKKMQEFETQEYDIIVEAGQSNAEGSGRGPVSEEFIPNEDICYLIAERKAQWFPDHVEITFFDKPFQWQIADERGEGEDKVGDFALTFGEEYVKAGYLQKGRKLLIIRTAVGATCFAKKDWVIGGRLYVKLMEMLDYALGLNKNNKIVAFLWHQGESDALDHYDPEQYVKDLKEMIAHFRTKYDAQTVPFLSGDFVRHWCELPENREMCDPIRAVCKKVAEETEYGAYIETDGLKSNGQEWGANDYLHFSRESLHILGRRYFEAYKKIR